MGKKQFKSFELPTKEQSKKSKYIVEDSKNGKRIRNITQTPLDLYLHKGYLTPQQYLAGNEYFRLWYYGAEKNLIKSINWNRESTNKTINPEAPYILELLYKKATNSIKGFNQRKIAFDVCCIGEFLNAVNISCGKNSRMNLLKNALDDLIKHFKIK